MSKKDTHSQKEEAISLHEIINILWSKKWLILIVFLICVLLGILAAIRQIPIYRVDASLSYVSNYSSDLSSALSIALPAGLGNTGNIITQKGGTHGAVAINHQYISIGLFFKYSSD